MTFGGLLRQRRGDLHLTQDQVSERAKISKPYLSNIETGRAKNPPTDTVLAALETVLEFRPGELIKLAHIERTPKDIREDHQQLQIELDQLRGVLKDLMNAPRKENGSVDLDSIASQLSGKLSGKAGAGSNIRTLTAGAAVPIINKVAAGYPQHFTDLDYPTSVADDYLRVPDLHDPQAFAARVVGDSMEPDYREGDIVVFSPNTPARSGNDCFVRFDGDFSTTFKRFYQDEERIRLQPLNSRYPAQSYERERVTGLWPAVFRFERLR